MTDEKLKEEIAWMKQMAEEGRKSPIVGGVIGIWWGVLSFVMMLVHWGSLTGRLAVLPIEKVGLAWLAYAIIGSLITFVLVNRMQNKPGFKSMTSQIAGSTWMLASVGIFTFSIGSVIATFGFSVPFWIFNAILPVALICYGIANGVTALLTGNRISGVVAAMSFVLALIMFPFLLSSTIYLIAAFAILLVAVMSVLSQGKVVG